MTHGRKINYIDNLYQALKKVIKDMDLVKNEAMKISLIEAHLQRLETAPVDQLQREISSTHVGSLTSSLKENFMVGFDQVFLEVLDKLTGGQLNCQIIPIMGTGGIGKTTLTRNLFENALVKEYFDIRAWTMISQTYNVRGTLREILFQASGDLSDLSEDDLGEKLYKYLSGMRYLIVIDDMWSIEVWSKIKFFFPNHQNESRIIVTTRLSNLGSQLNEFNTVCMKFLDEASSWGLFCKTVFGKENCPLELESVGKNIVANCKGLPLSIATIGGLVKI
ncbi:late blight resistance protein R1-A-like [Salvia hispanica]|uniref:late blight resistance protein R1-A-like n=1 Tax=Salvia hispanica TaxID=49212 RepID=UPI0020091728|nr:late blight resistance protein R1-A-like [Salvia hispanica]